MLYRPRQAAGVLVQQLVQHTHFSTADLHSTFSILSTQHFHVVSIHLRHRDFTPCESDTSKVLEKPCLIIGKQHSFVVVNYLVVMGELFLHIFINSPSKRAWLLVVLSWTVSQSFVPPSSSVIHSGGGSLARQQLQQSPKVALCECNNRIASK